MLYALNINLHFNGANDTKNANFFSLGVKAFKCQTDPTPQCALYSNASFVSRIELFIHCNAFCRMVSGNHENFTSFQRCNEVFVMHHLKNVHVTM